MRTLLRRVSSGLYFQGADQWTDDPEQARNFKSIDHALEFIRKWKLRGIELAFNFHNSPGVRTVSVKDTSLKYSRD
jgi:hypothetical protein